MTSVPVPEVDLRPQSVLLTFFGDFVDGDGAVVAASGVVELLEGAGIGAHATRATLNRMVKRGLLHRVPAGRQALFGLTGFGRRTVLEGRERAQRTEVVDRHWDARWTLVSFSLPEDAQRQRHELRSRLAWAGFGLVQSGLWAAPRAVDVTELLDGLDVRGGVNAFYGHALPPTEEDRLVSTAYDISGLSTRYQSFVDRWSPLAGAHVDDPLLARLVLSSDWLMALRDDPRLPVQFLPDPWPGTQAQELHHALESALRAPSLEEAAARLDVRTVGD